jgi:hypothetical protein
MKADQLSTFPPSTASPWMRSTPVVVMETGSNATASIDHVITSADGRSRQRRATSVTTSGFTARPCSNVVIMGLPY